MNSKDRRTFFRSWRASHESDVERIISFIKNTRRHFVLSHIDDHGVLVMKEETLFSALGQSKTREQWREFLRSKGVIDFLA